MKRLDYIVNVWNDLDINYELYIKNNAKITKLNYLKKLINFNLKAAGSTILEDYLSEEVASYNVEEYAKYEELRIIFNKVFDSLKIFTGTINNLNSFVKEQCLRNVPEVNIEPELEDNSDDSLTIQELSYEQMIDLGYITDMVLESNNKAVLYHIKDNDGYVALPSTQSLREFLTNNQDDTFYKKCYATLVYFAKINKLNVPMIMLSGDNNLFHCTDKVFRAGNFKHNCTKVDNGTVTVQMQDGDKVTVENNFVYFRMRANRELCTVVGVL